MGHVITLPTLFAALRSLVFDISALAILRLVAGTPEARYAEALLTITGASAAPGMILPFLGDGVDEEFPPFVQFIWLFLGWSVLSILFI